MYLKDLAQFDFEIAYINRQPMERLKFADFKSLKCGRDELSRLRLPQLMERLSADEWRAITGEFENASDQSACARWRIRGLALDKAIRKVTTDIEVRMNAIGVSTSRMRRRRA
jgi:hypothetical protein